MDLQSLARGGMMGNKREFGDYNDFLLSMYILYYSEAIFCGLICRPVPALLLTSLLEDSVIIALLELEWQFSGSSSPSFE